MRTNSSHHFNLQPSFMARAAGNGSHLATNEKPVNSGAQLSDTDIIRGYKENIETLRSLIDEKTNPSQEDNLDKFFSLVESGIKSDFCWENLEIYKSSVFDDLSIICSLAHDADLPEDVRKKTIEDLAAHLHVCPSGMAQNIEQAARKLEALKHGLPQNFINQLINVINAEILNYMRDNNIGTYKGNEIHDVAAFFNYIAPNFGLRPRADALESRISAHYLDQFTVHIHDKIIIDRVIEVLAEECRSQIIHELSVENFNIDSVAINENDFCDILNIFNDTVQPKLTHSFGPIPITDVFVYSDEGDVEQYHLIKDNTLLMRSIARNLREAGAINFHPSYLAGEKGAGTKLKISGENIVYVSTTNDAKEHHQQILEEFVWRDASKSKELLDKLNYKATEKPEIKKFQDDILQRISLSAVTRMLQSKDLAEVGEILNESMAFIWSDTAKEMLLATSMAQALGKKRPDIAEIILSMMSGQHLGNEDGDGNTVLHRALRTALQKIHPQLTKSLIKSIIKKMSEQQLSLQNNNGHTAFMLALKMGDPEIISILLDRTDPSQFGCRDRNGDTAMMIALKHNNFAIVPQLAERMRAAQLDLENKANDDALGIAFANNQPGAADVIARKMSHEALLDRHQRLLEKLTTYHAALGGDVKIVHSMLPQHLGLKNRRGDTALMITIKKDLPAASLALIAKMTPAQLGICDKDGNNAMMLALERGDTKIALAIMKKMHRKQLETRNRFGETAFIFAKNFKQTEMCRRIVKAIDPPTPGFFTRIRLFFMNMVPEQYQSDSMRAKLTKFYWY